MMDIRDFVFLTGTNGYAEAKLLGNLLRKHSIENDVRRSGTLSDVFLAQGGASGPFGVYVKEGDLEKAEDLLRNMDVLE